MAFFSSKDLPNVRPIADFNFAATKVLDSRINFSRGSSATYIDELGTVRYAPHNVPRFDHDPTTGESLGLLIEESSTNTKTNSQDFTSGWNRSGVEAMTQNTSIATPSGSIDSTGVGVLTESSGGSVHQLYAASTSQVTKYITYSIFAKPNGRNHIQLVTSGFTHNLADGTTSGSASGEFISAKTEKLSNGWCRCSVVRNHNNSYDQFNIKLSNGSSTSYSGDGSSGVYIWGAQQEDKAFLTSYIPTSGTTEQRKEDRAVVKGEKFKKIFDASFNSFSVLVDYNNIDTAANGASNGVFHLWGEALGYDDRITISSDNDTVNTAMRTRAFGGGGGIFANSDALSASNRAATQKFAFSWSVPDYNNTSSRRWAFSFSGEDIDVVSNTTGTSVPQVTRLGLGINPTRLDEHGGKTHYKRVAIYNTVLSDEELKGLSAI